MIRLSNIQAFVGIVSIINQMTISMDPSSIKTLEASSQEPKIQPIRELFMEHENPINQFKTSTSTYPDSNAFPTFKRPRLGHRDEDIERQDRKGGYQVFELQSLDGHTSEFLKRLRDGTILDRADLSLGPPLEVGSSMRTMENLKGSSQGEAGMIMLNSASDQHSNSLSSQRSMFDKHEHASAYLGPNHSGPEEEERYDRRKMGREKNIVHTPYLLQIDHRSTPNFSQKITSQSESNNPYKVSVERGMTSMSSIRQDFEPSSTRIDIRNFHLHHPNKMLSAAAIYYTEDLIDTLAVRYPSHAETYQCPSWELGKSIWTSERLLPFVYFVISCNPNRGVWKNIKYLTILILRAYHKYSIEKEIISDEERLMKFILWHTEVIYHITLLKPMVNSSRVMMKTRGFSTLSRIFLLMNDDLAFKTLLRTNSLPMFTRHVSETFEDDYQLGYPIIKDDENPQVSILQNWLKKSNEIRNLGMNVPWPGISKVLWEQSKPVLWVNGEIEHDRNLKDDQVLCEFINQWENDLKKMLLFIKASQPTNLALPNLSLKQICRGIHLVTKKSTQEELLYYGKPIEYQVTLFSLFLLQKLND
ncbi:hypothetical protein DFH28DRAFT_879720 [Melampsora americana]|nr:hypothetical protein DFH28DRAFT_879720 [Melampsora americana]